MILLDADVIVDVMRRYLPATGWPAYPAWWRWNCFKDVEIEANSSRWRPS